MGIDLGEVFRRPHSMLRKTPRCFTRLFKALGPFAARRYVLRRRCNPRRVEQVRKDCMVLSDVCAVLSFCAQISELKNPTPHERITATQRHKGAIPGKSRTDGPATTPLFFFSIFFILHKMTQP